MTNEYNPGKEGVSVTASPNISTVQESYDANRGVNGLISAFGLESNYKAATGIANDYRQKQLTEQTGRIDAYITKFQEENGNGAVSEAQLGNRFPETVGIIRAKMQETMGAQQARTAFGATKQKINSIDAIKVDTNNRNSVIQENRNAFLESIKGGDDFYKASALREFDKQTADATPEWEKATAAHQNDTQRHEYKYHIGYAAGNKEITADEAASQMLIEDGKFEMSSSVSELQRRSDAADVILDLAKTGLGDRKVLARFPKQWHTADTLQKFAAADIHITDMGMKALRDNILIKEEKDKADYLRGQQLALKSHLSGTPPDQEWQALAGKNPKLYNEMASLSGTSLINPGVSAAAVADVAEQMRTSQASGKPWSEDDYIKALLGNRSIRPQDQAMAISQVSQKLEAAQLMNNKSVDFSYKRAQSQIDVYLKNMIDSNLLPLEGTDVSGKSRAFFDEGLRHKVEAYYADFKKAPSRAEMDAMAEIMVDSTIANAQLMLPSKKGTQPTQPSIVPTQKAQPLKPGASPLNGSAIGTPIANPQATPKPKRTSAEIKAELARLDK